MEILRHGIDLVAIDRIEGMVREHGERFLLRCFHEQELTYARSKEGYRAERLAVRFAAKEATFKALGTGWGQGVSWTDAWIRNKTGGEPELMVEGQALEVAFAVGVSRWVVSLTHSGGMAVASVIGVGG